MSKYLIDDKTMIVFPKLAKAIGLNESLMLQQMHYWLLQKKNVRDSYYWVFNSYQEWVDNDFIFWSHSTVKRVIKSLEEQDLVISVEGIYNKRKGDKTKWYRIDYNKLNEITSQFETFDGTVKEFIYSGQNEQSDFSSSVQNDDYKGQYDPNTKFNMTQPLPKITPKITNNIKDMVDSKESTESLVDLQFEEWWKIYDKKVQKPKAKTSFKRVVKKYGYDELKANTEFFVKNHVTDKQYQPYPTTFLNGYHSEDDRFKNIGNQPNKNNYYNNTTNQQQQTGQYKEITAESLYGDV